MSRIPTDSFAPALPLRAAVFTCVLLAGLVTFSHCIPVADESSVLADYAADPTDFARLESVTLQSTGVPIAGMYDPVSRRVIFVMEAAGADSGIYTMEADRLNATLAFQRPGIVNPISSAVIQPYNFTPSGTLQAMRGIYVGTSSGGSSSEARLFRLNPVTLQIEAKIDTQLPTGKLSLVLNPNKNLYVASRSQPNTFYEVDISENFAIKRILPTSYNYTPTSGFVDKSSTFLYFVSNSTANSQIIRINTTSFLEQGRLNIPVMKGRTNSVMYDPVNDFAYLPINTRSSGLAAVSLKNFTFLPDYELDGDEQFLTTSIYDARTSYGFMGSNTGPSWIYWVDFKKPSPSFVSKLNLDVFEDYTVSVVIDPQRSISVWGCQGYLDDPSRGLFPVFVSVKIPSDLVSPTPPVPDGDESSSDPSVPLPIFVAALFVSVGGVALLAVVYYKKKGKANGKGGYEGIKDKPRENALEVDPNIKIIEYEEIELGECIGMGGMGQVHRAVWNGTEIAVKKLHMTYQNLSSAACQDISNEMLLHSNLRHPNIITFLGACVYVPNICICLEYMERHSLYEVLHTESGQNIVWDVILKMAQDAARGMNFLHCSKPPIIHRDLKSHNLLVDKNWNVKVTDFGSARMKQHFAYTMTCIGTPQWMAPEVIRGEKYTEKCDVFSFGVVLWELFSRDDPHKGMNPIQVATAVAFRDLRPPIPPDCPAHYATLFTECWDSNPKSRPGFREVLSRITKMMASPAIESPKIGSPRFSKSSQ